MLRFVSITLFSVGLTACAAPDDSAPDLIVAPPSGSLPGLSADSSLPGRLFETLGACERFNRAPSGEQGFAAHLRRHAPTADETERRALRAAYDRGASPAVASRQTPESCAVALRGHAQQAPGLHGRRDDRPLASSD